MPSPTREGLSNRSPTSILLTKLGIVLVTLSVLFVAGEVAARLLSRTDADGNVFLRSTRLRPFKPPIAHVLEKIEGYESSSSTSVMYDPALGWSPRPDGSYRDGMYVNNSAGLRTLAGEDFSVDPEPGTTRIALFGDSFTESADVHFDASWGYVAQEAMIARGRNVEVLNFACGGWGMDQAFLRWREIGRRYQPDFVVFGFQAENARRNQNVLRPLYYYGTGLSFSKPRFVLNGDDLELVNSPAMPPREVVEVLRDLERWPLVVHESFYASKDYRRRWYSPSIALSALFQRLQRLNGRGRLESATYAPTSECGSLALRIVGEFSKEVSETGARFVLVHLPKRNDLGRLAGGQELVYADLFDALAADYVVCDPTAQMLDRAAQQGMQSLFVSPTNGHYSPDGNGIVGQALADLLSKVVEENSTDGY